LGALLHTYDKEAGYGGTNRGRFSNKEMDTALEEAMRSVDREKHKALLIKATEIAMREVGIIPLHYQVNIWAMQKGLTYTARTDGNTLAFDVHTAK
jgi:peptide/nickel transport system substrate-binding protein